MVEGIEYELTAAGCWSRLGRCRTDGYGVTGRSERAHVLSWTAIHGPVPGGLELDHLCSNWRCINPDHLEAVTHAENVRRGAAKRTHCRNGHAYGDAYLTSRGRRCRPCALETNRRWKAAGRSRVTVLDGAPLPGRPF